MALEQAAQVRRDKSTTELHRHADAQSTLCVAAAVGHYRIGFIDGIENRHGLLEIGLTSDGHAGVACGAIEQAGAQLVF